jgi:hypothetical protein
MQQDQVANGLRMTITLWESRLNIATAQDDDDLVWMRAIP